MKRTLVVCVIKTLCQGFCAFLRSHRTNGKVFLHFLKQTNRKQANNSLFFILWAGNELYAFSLVEIGFDPTSWRMLEQNQCRQLQFFTRRRDIALRRFTHINLHASLSVNQQKERETIHNLVAQFCKDQQGEPRQLFLLCFYKKLQIYFETCKIFKPQELTKLLDLSEETQRKQH